MCLWAGVLLGMAALSAASAAEAQAVAPQSRCFSTTDFRNWRARDAKTLYIRAGSDRIFRLDLGRECQTLLWPDAHLIMQTHGGSMICTALDVDLRVGQGTGGGIPDRCFVKALTELAPAEAEAIPKGERP